MARLWWDLGKREPIFPASSNSYLTLFGWECWHVLSSSNASTSLSTCDNIPRFIGGHYEACCVQHWLLNWLDGGLVFCFYSYCPKQVPHVSTMHWKTHGGAVAEVLQAEDPVHQNKVSSVDLTHFFRIDKEIWRNTLLGINPKLWTCFRTYVVIHLHFLWYERRKKGVSVWYGNCRYLAWRPCSEILRSASPGVESWNY